MAASKFLAAEGWASGIADIGGSRGSAMEFSTALIREPREIISKLHLPRPCRARGTMSSRAVAGRDITQRF